MFMLRRVMAPEQEDGSPVQNLLKNKDGKLPESLIEDYSLQERNNNIPMSSFEEYKVDQKKN
jgi:hypothetical protein